MPPTLRSRPVWLVAIITTLAVGSGCEDSRFPVCKTDSDCKESPPEGASAAPVSSAPTLRGTAKLCFDLRCVECRGDSDCGEGSLCELTSRTCKRIDGPAPKAGGPEPGEPGSGKPEPGSTPRDPEAWEKCVKACNDKKCIADCDAKYE